MNTHKIANLIGRTEYKSALWELAAILEHDVLCWKHIVERDDCPEYIEAFALDRVTALKIETELIYEELRK